MLPVRRARAAEMGGQGGVQLACGILREALPTNVVPMKEGRRWRIYGMELPDEVLKGVPQNAEVQGQG